MPVCHRGTASRICTMEEQLTRRDTFLDLPNPERPGQEQTHCSSFRTG